VRGGAARVVSNSKRATRSRCNVLRSSRVHPYPVRSRRALRASVLRETMAGRQLILPAAASLVDQLDKRVLVILRDGRNLVGVMRSFDQFSNVVLEDTVERRVVIPKNEGVNAVYGDAPLGLYVVRGDSIVLLGEVDDQREASPQHPAKMDIGDVLELERAGLAERAVVWDIEES